LPIDATVQKIESAKEVRFVTEGNIMTTRTATDARANLYKLIDDVSTNHEPVVITGKRGNAVLLAEEDWNSISETLHLMSVSGMRESILEGMQEPLGAASDDTLSAEDFAEDIRDFDFRVNKPTISYDELVAKLKANDTLSDYLYNRCR
jgi:prevent-host-death family protein